MFGFLDRLRGIEPRSSEIDLGALYQSVFAFGGGGYSFAQSPAILASSLSVLDNAGALLTESRRLGRTSPLLIAYRAIIESGLLTGAAEAPEFADTVPEAVAEAVATLWIDAHDVDRERDLLDRLVLDGEFLDPGRRDDSSARWFRRRSWRGRSGTSRGSRIQDRHGLTRSRMAGLRYVGDRPMGASPRLAVDRPGACPRRLVC